MKPLQSFFLIALVLAPVFSAMSQEKAESDFSIELPEIVVTATMTEKTEFEAPYMVDVITEDEVSSEMMSRTLPEALRQTPGVMVQKSGYGQASPFIRGFTGFRTLLLVDGIRLNNSTYRSGPNQHLSTVDPLSVSRIEVIKGPGSVLYGTDAVGGAVNMITLARGAEGPAGNNLRLLYRYAEAERSHSYRAEASGSDGNKVGAHIGGSFRDFGDYEAGRKIGHMPRTGYREKAADMKIEYRIGPATRLVLAYQRLDQEDVWRTHTTVYSKSFAKTMTGTERRRSLDQSRELFYMQAHGREALPLADHTIVSLSVHRQREEQLRIKESGDQDEQGVDVSTLGAFINLRKDLEKGNIIYGAEYYIDYVDSFKRGYGPDGALDSVAVQGPVGDDAEYEIAGAYLQGDLWLSERLELYLGGRYAFSRARARRVEDPATGLPMEVTGDWEALVGSARMSFYPDPARTVNFYAGASQAFRAPNLSDLTRMDAAHETGEVEIPAPGLDPERYLVYEAGVKAWTDRLFAQAGYYYTDIEDLIARTPTGNLIGADMEVTKKNAGDGYVEGVEASARLAITDSIDAFGAYTWTYGRVGAYPSSAQKKEREYKDRLMPQTGIAGVRWESARGKYRVEGVATFAEKADKLSSRDRADLQRIPPGGTPAYDVYSLRGGADLGQGLTVSAAVENITDRDYRVHGSGQNETGTNLIVGVEWRR
jgi:hemoglobin/transferrin/lactoferrin receptor protein